MKKIEVLKRIVVVVLIVSMITPMNIFENNVSASEKNDEYIVIIDSEKHMSKINEQYYGKKVKGSKKISLVKLNSEKLREIKENKNVEKVEKNIVVKGAKVNDEKEEKTYDWNLKMIRATKKKSIKDKKIKVALIDSGVNYNSSVNVKKRINLIEGEEEISPLFEDASGHGTSVAGIISGMCEDGYKIGVNNNVELYSIKVLDENKIASIDRIIEAIYMAIDLNVNIINMSFGTNLYSEALKIAIEDASKAGILLVAAAGNRGELDGKVEYPAAFEEVISVGSVNSKGEISRYSSKEGKVDVYAPGEAIGTTAIFDGSTICSGTSMAVPHVVGVASILWEENPNETADFIKNLVIKSVNKSTIGDKGIIDLQLAEKITNTFKEVYKKNEVDKYKADENEKIYTCNTGKYVEGSWSQNNHQNAVENNRSVTDYSGTKYTDKILKILVKGIRLPDADKTNMSFNKGQENEHCWWHAGTMNTYMYGNYVPNYLATMDFMMWVIRSTGCNIDNVQKPIGMSTYVYEEAKKNLKGADLNNIITQMGYKSTATNKRFLCWGIMMHTVTDMFAHRSYVKRSDGSYVYITDDGKKTDNISDVPERYKAACQVVKNIMSQCISVSNPYNSKEISAKQFSLSNKFYTGNFKLQNFYDFMKEENWQSGATSGEINVFNNNSITVNFKTAQIFG
jgi:hypothetical protein